MTYGETMEIRRVQLTGGSSYIITLPKEWIKDMKIKKNDQLRIDIQSDGTLLINPKISHEQSDMVKEISIINTQKQDYLFRLLIGTYISGYSSVKIVSQSKMPISIRNIIRSFTQLAIGPEVIEEGDSYVILKDLLNPAEMPFDKTLRRMYIIVRGMYEDTLGSIKKGDKNSIKEIIQRDNDIDRLHWLIARQYNIVLQDIVFSKKMNVNLRMASTYFLVSRTTERIADHIVRIAQNLLDLYDNSMNKKIVDLIISAGKLSLDTFNRSINSFFKKDANLANNVIEDVPRLEAICEEINSSTLRESGGVAIHIGYITESIRRIGEYSVNISENVIDYLVTEGEKTVIK